MPYVITTYEDQTDDHHGPSAAPVAVATLEEARDYVFTAIDEASGSFDRSMNSDEQRADRFLRLSVQSTVESGGTVGPLPDGTIIEVSRVKWDALRDHLRDRSIPIEYEIGQAGPTIIAAFNAS